MEYFDLNLASSAFFSNVLVVLQALSAGKSSTKCEGCDWDWTCSFRTDSDCLPAENLFKRWLMPVSGPISLIEDADDPSLKNFCLEVLEFPDLSIALWLSTDEPTSMLIWSFSTSNCPLEILKCPFDFKFEMLARKDELGPDCLLRPAFEAKFWSESCPERGLSAQ